MSELGRLTSLLEPRCCGDCLDDWPVLRLGLASRVNPMSILVLAFGAFAVASAVYVILDLSSPYSGVFRASPAPLEQVLAYMSQERGAVGATR